MQIFKRSFITKATKLRLLLNKPKPIKKPNIVPKVKKPSAAPVKRRVWREFYRDPYLLSTRLNTLITQKKDGIPKAFDLVMWNPGTCKKEVYGTMISSLAKEKRYLDIIKLYDIMIRRNRYLSPLGYTTIFHAMATYAKSGDWDHRSNCMRATDKIWNHAIDSEIFEDDKEMEAAEPKISTKSINALLHVCDICCDAGGYNLAWEVFEQMGNVAEYPLKFSNVAKCLADHVTYSMMMGICISAGNPNAFQVGIGLWKNYKHLLVEKPGKAFSTVENELVCKAITLCTEALEFDQGFQEIKTFFGLSTDSESKLKRKVYLSDINVILKLCRESKRQPLGLNWLKQIEKEQSSIFTAYKASRFYRHYVKSEISLKNFGSCYRRILKDNTCPLIYKLWVCWEALKANQDRDIWYQRFKELSETPGFENDLNHIYFYMKCGLLMGETEAVKSLLESKKEFLQRYMTKRLARRDGMVDYNDFRATVRKLMRWRDKEYAIPLF